MAYEARDMHFSDSTLKPDFSSLFKRAKRGVHYLAGGGRGSGTYAQRPMTKPSYQSAPQGSRQTCSKLI